MNKSPDAFRTISEVAEVLEIPAHVLRFWESRFPQVRPVKRAGGRRYYRPADVALLVGIKRLLHDEGMTIRGVQKILREQGVRVVSGVPDLPMAAEAGFSDDSAVDAVVMEQDVFAPAMSGEAVPSPAEAVVLQGALDLHGPGRWTEDPALPHDAEAIGASVPDPSAGLHPDNVAIAPTTAKARVEPTTDDPAAPVATAELSSDATERAFAPPFDIAIETEAQADEATPAARLRALHAAALPLPRAPLEALATRLGILRARMSAAARPHRR